MRKGLFFSLVFLGLFFVLNIQQEDEIRNLQDEVENLQILTEGLQEQLELLSLWATNLQEKVPKHSYLSQEYNEPYLPTVAEWQRLNFVATFNFTGYLTEELLQNSFVVLLQDDHVEVGVDVSTQPSWDVYLGNNKFAVSRQEVRVTFQKATKEIFKTLRRLLFPEYKSGLQDWEIQIRFFIDGSPVALWKDGRVRLHQSVR